MRLNFGEFLSVWKKEELPKHFSACSPGHNKQLPALFVY